MFKKLLLVVSVLCSTLFTFAQQERTDRIIASYMIAFGQVPQQSEIDYWLTDPLSDRSVTVLVEKHKQNMRASKALKGTAINNSYLSAFGKYPEPSEVTYWEKGSETYAELYANHLKFLTQYPDNRKATIRLSYLQGLNREPKKEEVDYWMSQSVMSFVDLKAHHFKNRINEPSWNRIDNAKNYTVTQLLITPVAKQEIKVTLNNMVPSAAQVISTGGLNVISTGGLNVISTGGLN